MLSELSWNYVWTSDAHDLSYIPSRWAICLPISKLAPTTELQSHFLCAPDANMYIRLYNTEYMDIKVNKREMR